MKRWVLFSGIVVFIFGALLIYISGIVTGPSETAIPIYPTLYAMQIYWTLMAVAGVALIILGVVFKNKKKK
jgi:hypothetical protein